MTDLSPRCTTPRHALRLADGVFTWWRLVEARRDRALSHEADEREAVDRWEDEGGNVK